MLKTTKFQYCECNERSMLRIRLFFQYRPKVDYETISIELD